MSPIKQQPQQQGDGDNTSKTTKPASKRSRTVGDRQSTSSSSSPETSSSIQTKVFVVVLTLAALLVGVYIQLTKNLSQNLNKARQKAAANDDAGSTSATIGGQTLIVADNMDAGYLDHVVATMLKFNHKLSFTGTMTPIKSEDLDQYNLIWTHDYPFTTIRRLQPLQRINHFPGTGFITNKMTLSTTPRIPHILKAFRLPMERDRYLAHIRENPGKMWIQKSSSHRGISIETESSVKLEPADLGAADTLVQEYMSNPLLIDGKKFDIGIYAVLTSVDPLRVYIYDAEALLRFCAHPYRDPRTNQFNSSDLDSYVVGDDYTPIWLMPSLLKHYVGANLSMKEALNSYLRMSTNKTSGGEKIWQQIEETIMMVYKMKESHLARMSRLYQEANNYNSTSGEGSLNQFFEMVRFDFIVDEHLNVFLMEANMSPNLSSRHFPPNRLLYEQVLQSYFSLVGLTQFAQQHLSNLPVRHLNGELSLPPTRQPAGSQHRGSPPGAAEHHQHRGLDGIISEKELAVYGDLCVSDECHMNCHDRDCKLCYFCLNQSDRLHLKRAIYEQYSKWNFKRLLPSTRDQDLELQLLDPDTREQKLDSNYMHVQWFRGKCATDARFCSQLY